MQTRAFLCQSVALLTLCLSVSATKAANVPSLPLKPDDAISPDCRSFRTGFTPFSHDMTPQAVQEMRAWRDCGVVGENDKRRPAYAIWRRWFAAPYSPRTGAL